METNLKYQASILVKEYHTSKRPMAKQINTLASESFYGDTHQNVSIFNLLEGISYRIFKIVPPACEILSRW